MMKRTVSLLLALVLVLSLSCSALAEDSLLFETKYFTLTLPAGWETEFEDLETIDDGEMLGYFFSPEDPGLTVGACMIYYEELKNLALWNSDADELQDYIDALLEDYAEDHPVYVGTVMAGSIPFVVIRAEDDESEYLYADTMTNGYAIEFTGYVSGSDSISPKLTDKAVEQFLQILTTFQPVTGS